jgi:hypothetical protein
VTVERAVDRGRGAPDTHPPAVEVDLAGSAVQATSRSAPVQIAGARRAGTAGLVGGTTTMTARARASIGDAPVLTVSPRGGQPATAPGDVSDPTSLPEAKPDPISDVTKLADNVPKPPVQELPVLPELLPELPPLPELLPPLPELPLPLPTDPTDLVPPLSETPPIPAPSPPPVDIPPLPVEPLALPPLPEPLPKLP